MRIGHEDTAQIKMHRRAKPKIVFTSRRVNEVKVDSKSKMLRDKGADYKSLTTFIKTSSSPHNTLRFPLSMSLPFSLSSSSPSHHHQFTLSSLLWVLQHATNT